MVKILKDRHHMVMGTEEKQPLILLQQVHAYLFFFVGFFLCFVNFFAQNQN